MMKLQGLIVTTWSLSGDRRSTFGFDALPFVRVVFFPPLFEVYSFHVGLFAIPRRVLPS